jgi:[protein-PII] uridylyltransferase
VLTGEQAVGTLLAQRKLAGRGARSPVEPLVPPKVAIDNQLSDVATVVEVKCPDRLGLLYLITRTFSALDLDIVSARIATEIDQALDTFYVQARGGEKVQKPDDIDALRDALEQALVKPL